MKYHYLHTRLFGVPLLLTEDYAAAITTALADRLDIEPMADAAAVAKYKRPADSPVFDKATGIVTYPIVGSLVHRGGFLDAMSGMSSYTELQNDLSRLVDDPQVRGILLDVDSGGGEAAGLQELAEFITTNNQLGSVPIWALANTVAGSAAYWLASTTDRLYVAPGGRVGSIGVYVQHRDVSQAMAKKGIVTSFVFAGKHKIDGNMFEPLAADVREALQTAVDETYETFANAVASAREMEVDDVKATEAKMFGPKEAVELGLADGEATLGEVLTTFSNYLNRPAYGGTPHGVTMNERATYTQSDLDRARTEGHAAGAATQRSETDRLVVEGRKAERSAISTALADIFSGDKRAETFCEALNDGATVDFATKFAKKAEASVSVVPATSVVEKTYTQKDVDALMAKHAPGVTGDDANNADDPKAKRLAELTAGGAAFNQAKGYAKH